MSPIAGYVPGSDVTQHNAVDGDQANMETALNEYPSNFATATTHYATGGSSTSKGSFRTLKGFSTGAQAKMYDGCPGCPYTHYKQFYDYYGDFDYADKWVSSALAGTDMSFASGKFGPNNFSQLGPVARREAVKKGTVLMHVWMYAIRQFEMAIDDCTEFSTSGTYTYHAGPMAYGNAIEACQESGGNLATIRNQAEQDAAFAAVPRGARAYIGLNDRDSEGSFVWANGSAVSYTNWAGSEPNSFSGTDEDCAGFHIHYPSGEWNDFPCGGSDPNDGNAAIGYVCEAPATRARRLPGYGPRAWDKGVAFYTGYREGTAQGGNTDGVMVYRHAEKRCANFGTCALRL